MAEQPPSDEQLARDLAEELRKLRVEDVLIQTLVTISSIGYHRLGLTDETKDERDLEQARLAIETLQALTAVLERVIPEELVREFSSSVANLQLAYARTAGPARDEQATAPGDDADS